MDLGDYEGRLWRDIPWRVKVLMLCRYPRPTLRSLCRWFDEVTVLPGDVFEAPARDVWLLVREVKPRRVVVEVRTRQAMLSPRAGAVPAIESLRRSPLGWWVR